MAEAEASMGLRTPWNCSAVLCSNPTELGQHAGNAIEVRVPGPKLRTSRHGGHGNLDIRERDGCAGPAHGPGHVSHAPPLGPAQIGPGKPGQKLPQLVATGRDHTREQLGHDGAAHDDLARGEQLVEPRRLPLNALAEIVDPDGGVSKNRQGRRSLARIPGETSSMSRCPAIARRRAAASSARKARSARSMASVFVTPGRRRSSASISESSRFSVVRTPQVCQIVWRSEWVPSCCHDAAPSLAPGNRWA